MFVFNNLVVLYNISNNLLYSTKKIYKGGDRLKKILCVFCLMICIFGLCGCESSESDRDKILNALKKENIISDSMEQIDIMSYNSWPLEWCTTDNYYIYKDKNSKIIAITYEKTSHLKDSKYDHLVTICDGSHSYYKYQNGEYTDNSRYNINTQNQTQYEVTIKNGFFKDKYILNEHTTN